MKRTLLALCAALVLLVAVGNDKGWAQTATPTFKATPIATLAPDRAAKLDGFSPSAKWTNFVSLLTGLIENSNSSVKVIKIAGVDGTAGGTQLLPIFDTVGTVVAVNSYVTSTGAAAAKALLAPTTDYVVSGGKFEVVTDQSANTLVIFYTR